jgi:hypothetical protein
MKSNNLKLLLFLLFFVNINAKAYTVARQNVLPAKEATKHFLYIVGYSGTLGNTLVKSAITTAAKYEELYPRSYHLFIMGEDPQYQDAKLAKFPITLTHSDDNDLDASTLYKIADKHGEDFSAVHVFSHNSAAAGAGLQKTQRLTYNDKDIKKLAKTLAKDAYVFLHGCNSGWYEAPGMSEVLKVPVWGSFSGTDFEELYDVGEWFNHNEGNYPLGSDNPEFNSLSFSNPKKCSQGHCIRMRPDNSGYKGTWGKYNVGLGFYKQFCNKNKEEACLSAYKKMLLAYPSYHNATELYSYDSYKENLKDFLCPSRSSQTKYQECLKILDLTEANPSTVANLSSWKGKSLACNEKDNKCFFQLTGCVAGVCNVDALPGAKTRLSELQKEYLKGLKAFQTK